jgi:hypothetical protein
LDGTEPSPGDDRKYVDYVDSVLEEGTAAFFQIGMNMFVVNGWDTKTRRSKVSVSARCLTIRFNFDQDTWYHVQRSMIGSEAVFVCTCPASSLDVICVHEYLLREYGLEIFPPDSDLAGNSLL